MVDLPLEDFFLSEFEKKNQGCYQGADEVKRMLLHKFMNPVREFTGHPSPESPDALVNIKYYMLNTTCKKGINLAGVFQVVHNANMEKRDKRMGSLLVGPRQTFKVKSRDKGSWGVNFF